MIVSIIRVVFSIFVSISEGEEVSWDVEGMREEDFERDATYFVPDLLCPPRMTNRAEATLPRNLTLRASQTLRGKVGGGNGCYGD